LNDIPWLKNITKKHDEKMSQVNSRSHDLYGTIFEDDNRPEVDTQKDDETQNLPDRYS